MTHSTASAEYAGGVVHLWRETGTFYAATMVVGQAPSSRVELKPGVAVIVGRDPDSTKTAPLQSEHMALTDARWGTRVSRRQLLVYVEFPDNDSVFQSLVLKNLGACGTHFRPHNIAACRARFDLITFLSQDQLNSKNGEIFRRGDFQRCIVSPAMPALQEDPADPSAPTPTPPTVRPSDAHTPRTGTVVVALDVGGKVLGYGPNARLSAQRDRYVEVTLTQTDGQLTPQGIPNPLTPQPFLDSLTVHNAAVAARGSEGMVYYASVEKAAAAHPTAGLREAAATIAEAARMNSAALAVIAVSMDSVLTVYATDAVAGDIVVQSINSVAQEIPGLSAFQVRSYAPGVSTLPAGAVVLARSDELSQLPPWAIGINSTAILSFYDLLQAIMNRRLPLRVPNAPAVGQVLSVLVHDGQAFIFA